MKIKSVQMKNFRGFSDETVFLDKHTCLVGPNGAGKSTILCALNIFFQDDSNSTDVVNLTEEDFHNGAIGSPIEVTVTFDDLSEGAKEELSHYVRHDELVVTAVAEFDSGTRKARVSHAGERLVFKKFAPYFKADKDGEKVDALRPIFAEAIKDIADIESLGSKATKVAMTAALRSYEEAHPELCEQQRSSDIFYGTGKAKGKLDPYVQWVYLPAVKDASEEAEEASNTALGKLLQRTVRTKVNFDEALETLRQKARDEYDQLLESEQKTLEDISGRLAKRLALFSHPGTDLTVHWVQGSDRSVSISEPKAGIRAQEGKFKGPITRFGHGLQRSFLLAILQELASLEHESGQEESGGTTERPTLIFACEEPELYQHPPQARHLATVLRSLTSAGNQILITTHSPYFVSGEAFEEIRLIRKEALTNTSFTRSTTFEKYADRVGKATGKKPDKPKVARAKLYAALRPESSEIYFAKKIVFVEGIEDRAYLTSVLHLEDHWELMRREGVHIASADMKSNILQLLSISQELEIPCFVIFDADGHVENPEQRNKHKTDNTALVNALGKDIPIFPHEVSLGDTYTIWPETLERQVKADLPDGVWEEVVGKARQAIDPGASLKKNPVLIGEALSRAWEQNAKPKNLVELAERVARFAAAGS